LIYNAPLNCFTVHGKVKNFTSKTYQVIALRFSFYDRNNRLVHTETRYILVFERFRPKDVRSFAEQFFELPDETRKVGV